MSKSQRNDASHSGMPLRIGTVPYCNAWPLDHFLPNQLPGSILSKWIPSALRLRLMAHHLDVALLPVAELINLPYGKIIGNCCIASGGPVRNIRLVCRQPIETIKTIAFDPASRSGIALCDLILRHFYDLTPTRYKLNSKKPLGQCKFDAFVVIGDAALTYLPSAEWKHCYDLGELWQEKTGLPFVSAAWVGCSEHAWGNPELAKALEAARDRGLEQIDLILDEQQRDGITFPVDRETLKSYLSDTNVYRFGEKELLGLQSFFDLALIHGLAKHRTVVEIVSPS